MKRTTQIAIPDDVQFSDLSIRRSKDGAVSFDWAPIRRICASNGIDVDIFTSGPEDNVASLIMTWYMEHRRRGGDIDPVAEDLISETIAEDKFGGGLSHQPGRA